MSLDQALEAFYDAPGYNTAIALGRVATIAHCEGEITQSLFDEILNQIAQWWKS